MLKQRVWAALVLILAFLAALFYLPPTAWAILMGIVTFGAAWEWARLTGLTGLPRVLYPMFVCILLAILHAFSGQFDMQIIWLAVLLFWLVFVPLWLFNHWAIQHHIFLLLVGLIVLVSTWLAFVSLRDTSPLLLLLLMGLVWIADSAAYFAGRQFGKHKLAPKISPGKTWEGVAGALIVAIIYVWLWRYFYPEILARFAAASWLGLGLATIGLVAVSITGDLFESHLKRVAGLKDSGNLIPGHGGILDRIDSQTSVLPVAMALIYFFGMA